MTQVYEHLQGDANLWKHFSRYDKVAPGQAGVGMLHFAQQRARLRMGQSDNYAKPLRRLAQLPDFQDLVRQVNCADWSNGALPSQILTWSRGIDRGEWG